MKVERMYVFPKFKKLIKQEALEKGKTVMEWTKEFTEKQEPLHQLSENIRKKGVGKLDFP
jgi:hypothetical protein